MDTTPPDHLQSQLAMYRERLQHALEQQRVLGAYTPFYVAHDIAQCRQEIAARKAALLAQGVSVENAPEDEATAAERAEARAGAPGAVYYGDIVEGDKVSGDKVSGDKHVHNYYAPPIEDPVRALRVALQVLDTMPTDAVPEVAPLPVPHRMPLAVNPLFVGREDELKALAGALKGGTTTVIAAATGMGGVGKTQLASEFVHRYGQFFAGGVFWVSFASASGVDAEIAACGQTLGLAGFEVLELADQVARVRQLWQEAMPRLLVFDNCEDEALLERYRPTSGGARVMVTSRRRGWDVSFGLREQQLGTLPRAESIALLRKFCPDLAPDDTDLNNLAAELGDLPLALHVAGSYLQHYAQVVTPASYLAKLRAAPLQTLAKRLTELAKAPTKHELDVARTFALSYEQLNMEVAIDVLAASLLARAARFAPGEPVPHYLLALTLLRHDNDDEEAALDREDALKRLYRLGLIDIEEDGALRLHRLLSAFVQIVANDDAAQAAVEQAIIATAYDLNEKGYPAALLPLQTHLRYVTEAALSREDDLAASLCTHFGSHLMAIANYAQARPLYERALAIREYTLGHDHPQTVTSLNYLATLLQLQGAYVEARPLLERALTICERTFGHDHPQVVVSLNNLAELLRVQGAYAEAQPLLKRALTICERTLGDDHPYMAASLNNLATLLRAQGAYVEARSLYEQALVIRERTLGSDHPQMATSLNNLAGVLQAQGAYVEARPLYEQALSIYEHTLGPDHPHTASALNNLGGMLEAQGAYVEAQLLYEQALDIHERSFGPNHLETATSLSNLAGVFRAQGAYVEARSLYEQALMIHERIFGFDHPQTATILNNLATVLGSDGSYAEAQSLFERALAIQERTLGPDHPQTAILLSNLTAMLQAQGDYVKALPLVERALAIHERTLGPDHPQTATILNNLAGLFESQGAYAKARSLYERALAIYERTLGSDHPQTVTILNDLAVLCYHEDHLTEAAKLMGQALAIREQVLGSEHPDTHRSRQSLAAIEQELRDSVPQSREDESTQNHSHSQESNAAGITTPTEDSTFMTRLKSALQKFWR